MEKDVVLSAHNISKKYYVNKSNFLGRKKKSEEFWALDEVSFEVHKGEILGIIGVNGSGKSTILKILSGIIAPSGGYVEYDGSILSILDVGTGFHPDLTGYDNIFFNGSLLGLKHDKIKGKVQDIVEFSGIGDFINEPVKSYSNGMYLRLALSIALFTENEIILLDEVMSVGDEEFRYKAIQKIKDQAAMGKACIMVSHDLDSVLELCDHCILIEKGKIIYSGKSKDVVADYFNIVFENIRQKNPPVPDHPNCTFLSAIPGKSSYYMDEPIVIKIRYRTQIAEQLSVILRLRNHFSTVMRDSESFRAEYVVKKVEPGVYETQCTIPANLLNAGSYFVDILLGTLTDLYIDFPFAAKLTVLLRDWEVNRNWNQSAEVIPFRPMCNWETVAVPVK